MKASQGNKKYIVRNKKANFQYEVLARYECGIELLGTEVKSIREGRVNIADAFSRIRNQEIFLVGMNISPYKNSGYTHHDPLRRRKLLMHRREIVRLKTKLNERGFTLIPLSMYFKRGWVKVELGLCKGKRKHDKRQSIKKREAQREIRQYK